MTSKELNEILNKTRRTNNIELSVEQVKEIIKDLEVLEILKQKKYIPLDKLNPKWWLSKEVYNEVCNYDYYLWLCKDYEVKLNEDNILTEEEFNLIEEWLDNGKD